MELLQDLVKPEIFKPLMLNVSLMTLMMANGATVIVFYAVNICMVSEDTRRSKKSYKRNVVSEVHFT